MKTITEQADHLRRNTDGSYHLGDLVRLVDSMDDISVRWQGGDYIISVWCESMKLWIEGAPQGGDKRSAYECALDKAIDSERFANAREDY